jgi:hypothetical protein
LKILSAGLTTCDVVQDGRAVRLDLIDEKGGNVSVQLPFDQAQAVAMTLPSLLTRALRSITGSDTSRYVFHLDQWVIEQAEDRQSLLLTLGTEDGFQVSFGIPAAACRGLGMVLAEGPDALVDGNGASAMPALKTLN